MSWDVSLERPDHWPQGAYPTELEANITYNCAPMWRAAGLDVRSWDGKRAGDLVEPIESAVAAIKADPEKYQLLEPANGWGSTDWLLEFLGVVACACNESPDAIVRVR